MEESVEKLRKKEKEKEKKRKKKKEKEKKRKKKKEKESLILVTDRILWGFTDGVIFDIVRVKTEGRRREVDDLRDGNIHRLKIGQFKRTPPFFIVHVKRGRRRGRGRGRGRRRRRGRRGMLKSGKRKGIGLKSRRRRKRRG